MSLKYSHTKADYLDWYEAQSLIIRLENDKQFNFALLFAVGIFTGLRISDILNFRWSELLNQEILEINEKKTGKVRKIKLKNTLQDLIKRLFIKNASIPSNYIITGKNSLKPLSVQYLNKKLKQIKLDYRLKIKNISTHTFRKTFGRHVWEMNNHSEKSLLLLSELFNHSSIAITKRYLGIKQEELLEIYDLL